ncbi:hypothetical protein AZ54_07090 [Xanthomonas oryzae pv. oryzae PXO86]|nr:hypothetical protein AZ54_07090 [Xanthomonas oryzae pv. oryzae PXO86]
MPLGDPTGCDRGRAHVALYAHARMRCLSVA